MKKQCECVCVCVCTEREKETYNRMIGICPFYQYTTHMVKKVTKIQDKIRAS